LAKVTEHTDYGFQANFPNKHSDEQMLETTMQGWQRTALLPRKETISNGMLQTKTTCSDHTGY